MKLTILVVLAATLFAGLANAGQINDNRWLAGVQGIPASCMGAFIKSNEAFGECRRPAIIREYEERYQYFRCEVYLSSSDLASERNEHWLEFIKQETVLMESVCKGRQQWVDDRIADELRYIRELTR